MPTKRGRRLIYARPSFLEGMERTFDIGGTLNVYYFAPDGAESDDDAPQSDRERMRDERAAVLRGSRRADLGIACGFIISLLLIAIGTYIAVVGNPWAGAAVIMAQPVGFAALFVSVTNARRRERERKAADATPRRD